MTLANIVNYTLSTLTVLGQISVLVVAVMIILKKYDNVVMNFLAKNGMKISFAVALLAMLGSLTYSDILHYEPCKLCWFQRIFMYPEVVLLGLGLLRKDNAISFYALILSVIGAPIAFYHYLVQLGLVKAGCSTVGYSVSCAKYFTMNFGYITIPMMAFTAFLMIAFALVSFRKNNLNNS